MWTVSRSPSSLEERQFLLSKQRGKILFDLPIGSQANINIIFLRNTDVDPACGINTEDVCEMNALKQTAVVFIGIHASLFRRADSSLRFLSRSFH